MRLWIVSEIEVWPSVSRVEAVRGEEEEGFSVTAAGEEEDEEGSGLSLCRKLGIRIFGVSMEGLAGVGLSR